jgi:hypothetical protein
MSTARHIGPYRRPALAVAMLAAALATLCGCGEEPVPLGRVSDGERVTELKLEDGKQFVEQDGRRIGGTFESVRSLQHTPDGEVVFAAKSGGSWSVYHGEKPLGGRYERCTLITTSPNGTIAFVGRTAGKWKVVLDGEELDGAFDNVRGLVFSRDGRSFAFAAEEDGQAIVVRDGVRTNVTYETVMEPRFSDNGSSLFYIGVDANGLRVVRNGKPVSEAYRPIDHWVVSPDGDSVAMLIETPSGISIVKDGVRISEEHPTRGRLGEPIFAPDGRTVVYAARSPELINGSPKPEANDGVDAWAIYLDGVPLGHRFDAERITDIVFSPNGQNVACIMHRGGRVYVGRNGQAVSEGFDRIINLRNRPDGKALVFSGLRGQRTTQVEIPW